MNLEQLVEHLKNKIAPNNVADQELIATIVADSLTLSARAAAGEDVDSELAHVKAQALNLSREARRVLSAELFAWVRDTISGLLVRAIPVA